MAQGSRLKWLVEGGHRPGEVNRRTLSDRRTLRQRHGQTGNTAPVDGSTSLLSKTVITLGFPFHKYDVAGENNYQIGGLADVLVLDSGKQYILQTC